MNILNIEHVSKVFGDKVIFDDVSYGIHEGDKIGIIGINGQDDAFENNCRIGRDGRGAGDLPKGLARRVFATEPGISGKRDGAVLCDGESECGDGGE